MLEHGGCNCNRFSAYGFLQTITTVFMWSKFYDSSEMVMKMLRCASKFDLTLKKTFKFYNFLCDLHNDPYGTMSFYQIIEIQNQNVSDDIFI